MVFKECPIFQRRQLALIHYNCNAENYCLVVAFSIFHNVHLRGPPVICYIVNINAKVGHDDVIKWKHFPRYWSFVRGIHRSAGNSPYKGQWRGALMFSLICVWINDWVNNRKAGDLMLSCSLWRHCNEQWISRSLNYNIDLIWLKRIIILFKSYLFLLWAHKNMLIKVFTTSSWLRNSIQLDVFANGSKLDINDIFTAIPILPK